MAAVKTAMGYVCLSDCSDLWGFTDWSVTDRQQQTHDMWHHRSTMLCRHPRRLYCHNVWTLQVPAWILSQRSFPLCSGLLISLRRTSTPCSKMFIFLLHWSFYKIMLTDFHNIWHIVAYTEVICKTMSTSPAYCCHTALGNINFWFMHHIGWFVPSTKLFKWLRMWRLNLTNERFVAVSYYHDVQLNAGARDASSTCAITVTLTFSSMAVCQHTDVCISQLSYCSAKLSVLGLRVIYGTLNSFRAYKQGIVSTVGSILTRRTLVLRKGEVLMGTRQFITSNYREFNHGRGPATKGDYLWKGIDCHRDLLTHPPRGEDLGLLQHKRRANNENDPARTEVWRATARGTDYRKPGPNPHERGSPKTRQRTQRRLSLLFWTPQHQPTATQWWSTRGWSALANSERQRCWTPHAAQHVWATLRTQQTSESNRTALSLDAAVVRVLCAVLSLSVVVVVVGVARHAAESLSRRRTLGRRRSSLYTPFLIPLPRGKGIGPSSGGRG